MKLFLAPLNTAATMHFSAAWDLWLLQPASCLRKGQDRLRREQGNSPGCLQSSLSAVIQICNWTSLHRNFQSEPTLSWLRGKASCVSMMACEMSTQPVSNLSDRRYQIIEYLGSAAFSRAVPHLSLPEIDIVYVVAVHHAGQWKVQCLDLDTNKMVCMKIIKNDKAAS